MNPIFAKTTQSLWRESYQDAPIYQSLSGEVKVDVAIVGAGITGISTALLLKEAGLTVAVLDKYTVGSGTSGRTTGKVSSQHSLIYADLHDRLGEDVAQTYGQANQAAIKQIESNIQKYEIDCDWERDDHYVFTTDPKQFEKFQYETDIASKLGLPAYYENKTPLPFDTVAAIRFSNQAKMNTQKYLLGLAATVNGDGSFVFENSHVIGMRDGNPSKVQTKQGLVMCKDVVVATSVPTLPLGARVGYAALEYPTESYIVAAPLNKDLPGMYISPDQTHFSILPINNGKQRYLLIGGKDHVAGVRSSRSLKFKWLEDYAKEYFDIGPITHKWSDRDYLAYDDVPLIGKLHSWSKHMYVGTAYHKWGLTNGTVAGMLLRDLITGKPNEWAKVFTPQRLEPVKSIPRVILQHLLP